MIRLPRSRMAFSLASALLLVTLGGGIAVGAGRAASATVTSHAFPSTSCQGVQACDGVTGTVGSGACNGFQACLGAAGNVDDRSCNGYQACADASGNIGHDSCNGGYYMCESTAGNIGHDSCYALSACLAAPSVGNSSCHGENACTFATGNVANGSCLGWEACFEAGGSVGNESCRGLGSCTRARGPIGNHACNGGNATCKDAGPVPDCARNVPGHVPTPCSGTLSVMGTSTVPATAGQPVTVWATVFARHPIVGKPGGRFRFRIDGKTLENDVVIDRYGRASVTRSFGPGVHWISGRYLGDGTFRASTPVPMLQFVVK